MVSKDDEQLHAMLMQNPNTMCVRVNHCRELLLGSDGTFFEVTEFPDGTLNEMMQLCNPIESCVHGTPADLDKIGKFLAEAKETITKELARLQREQLWLKEFQRRFQSLKTVAVQRKAKRSWEESEEV